MAYAGVHHTKRDVTMFILFEDYIYYLQNKEQFIMVIGEYY